MRQVKIDDSKDDSSDQLTIECSQHHVACPWICLVLFAPNSSLQRLVAALRNRIDSRCSSFLNLLFRRRNMFRALSQFPHLQQPQRKCARFR